MNFKRSLVSAAVMAAVILSGCSDADSSSEKESKASKAESIVESSAESKAESGSESKTDSEAQPETEEPAELPTNIIDGVDYLVLVSYGHKLPDDWADKITIESFTNSQDYDVFVEKRAMEAYKQLKADLEKEDIHIDIDTGYRSVAEQEEIMQRYRERYGLDYVKQYVAVPGYSEHQSALAIDLYLNVDGKDIIYNEDLEQYTEIWDKIHAKLADYGFILRYST